MKGIGTKTSRLTQKQVVVIDLFTGVVGRQVGCGVYDSLLYLAV